MDTLVLGTVLHLERFGGDWKLGLLKMTGEFSLENDALKAEAPYFKAVLTYQGCLLSITEPGMDGGGGGRGGGMVYSSDHGRHPLCPGGAQCKGGGEVVTD